MVTLNRKALVKKLQHLLGADFFIRDSEEFDGRKKALWVSGESYSDKLEDCPASGPYTLNQTFEKCVNDAGWYVEFYDAGTLMLYKNE